MTRRRWAIAAIGVGLAVAIGAGGYFLGIKVMRNAGPKRQRVHQILSVAGDHFIYARNRDFDLPMANSLADLIKKCEPTSKAKYLEFTTFFDTKQMSARTSAIRD